MSSDLFMLQRECACWVQETYGDKSLFDKRNRAARFMEEATELAQVEEVTREQALAIVERCYSRHVGERDQEIAGALFTFLVYLYAVHYWPEKAFDLCQAEVDRVRSIDPEHFRAKQREKFAAGTDLIAPK